MSARLYCFLSILGTSAVLFFLPARAQQPVAAAAPSNSTSPALTSPADAAQAMITSAVKKINTAKPDVDGAINDLSQAIKLNPNSTGAYVLRASLYCQEKQWTLAEDDFRSAGRLAPKNVVLKFQLIDVKFMQKQYDAARPGFVALQNDPDMGDFASYMVFLCDLFGGHEAAAKKELDVFNDAMGNPSYYFGNAAWSLVHNNNDDARDWLMSASRIYPREKNAYYAQSLHDMGYLQRLDPSPAQ
jgi:Tfp pilus assembly protein PilF